MLGLTNKCVDRAEHSKRQDWSLEASFDIFPLLDPLLSYTVKTLLDKSNVLRDSVLMQAECLHFEAYVHVHYHVAGCIQGTAGLNQLKGNLPTLPPVCYTLPVHLTCHLPP